VAVESQVAEAEVEIAGREEEDLAKKGQEDEGTAHREYKGDHSYQGYDQVQRRLDFF